MTSQQVYSVIEKFGAVELRRYEPCVIAELDIDASFEAAGSRGFRPLFNFISGKNDADAKVAMTAPVLQDVRDAQTGGSSYSISFVMPAGSELGSIPRPLDGLIVLRDVAETTALAARFSGRWTRSLFDSHASSLAQAAHLHQLTLVGDPRFARYNPPWTPWFMRRNEVIWDVDEAA